MKLAELMRLGVDGLLAETRAFSPDDRVSAAIGYLRDSGSYDAFVEEETRTSAVTLRDLLDVWDLETRLSKVMHQVPRLGPKDSVGAAASLIFEYRARSMPVYQGKRLLGKVSAPDIVGRLLDSGSDLKSSLSEVMTPDPITIEPSAPISSARELMRRKKIDQVPVVDASGKLVNITTSADLVFNIAPEMDYAIRRDRRERDSDPAGEFGKSELVVNNLKDALKVVYENMRKNSANYSLITDGAELRGIVTYRDFMELLANVRASSARGPGAEPMYIVGLPEDIFEANLVKQKFAETVQLLSRVIPGIVEARAVIEAEGNNPAKKKNLVKVMVVTPHRQFSYSVFSFELGEAFDEIHSWAKRLVEQEKPSAKPNRKRSIGRRGQPPVFPD